jgi:transcriptional regulator with GAF, ATPase, and Fis domain
VITGGEALKLGETRGEQRALRRAMLTGGTVLFDEAAPKLSISAEACSGVVVPLSAGKRVCGLLAIESSRRRDFRASDLARYASIVEWAGLSLRLAQFRTWHRAEFGFDVWFDAARADFRSFARDFLAAARSRSLVVLHGPAGSGKLILTRWLHFESDACARPLRVFSCALGAPRGGLRGMLDALRAGSLVLDDAEELAPELQEELLCWLEGVDSAHERMDASDDESDADAGDAPDAARSARIFATTRMGLGDALRAGKLRRDLAVRLDRIQLCVPALKERREDILPLIESLADRFAREEGIAAPAFTDEALALLWRQSWPGNVRELENVVYKLVLLHPMEGGARRPITPDDVARIAHSFTIELARKLNSRHPLRSDLIAALRATRTAGGRINKTRAAQFLGWDPDTLVARMQDLGVGDASALDAPAWLNESAQVSGSSSGASDVDSAACEIERRAGEGRDDAHAGDPECRDQHDRDETRMQRELGEQREADERDATHDSP